MLASAITLSHTRYPIQHPQPQTDFATDPRCPAASKASPVPQRAVAVEPVEMDVCRHGAAQLDDALGAGLSQVSRQDRPPCFSAPAGAPTAAFEGREGIAVDRKLAVAMETFDQFMCL